MGNWKKIITSGSSADLLNITSSGGIQIDNSLLGGASGDLVLVRDASTGEIKTRTQVEIGNAGSSVNAFLTFDPSSGDDVVANTSTDTLNFVASDNITITGDSSAKSLTFSATTKSISDIQFHLSKSLTDGIHQNITINEYTSGVFSLTGSQDLQVSDTTGQTGIDLTFNSDNNSLSASLIGLRTNSSVRFADITATGNISASGFISASALHVKNDATIEGDLILDGDFNFDGFGFQNSGILNHSGSNIFGSGSSLEPSELFHEFTGSVSITGSNITLVDGIFVGSGSGLTDIDASALPSGIISSSDQLASAISGAYTADGVAIGLGANGTAGQFSAITATPANNSDALATGDQIFDYITTNNTTLLNNIASNYISAITTGAGLSGSGTQGDIELKLDLGNLTQGTPTATDIIGFYDTAAGATKKATIASLGAIITASSAGTVTSITTGNGLTGGTISTAGTITVDPGANITVNSDGVGVDVVIGNNGEEITNLIATSASFGKLTVTGDTTVIESETLKIADNFMFLNSNYGNIGPSEDAGISVNRGTSLDANLYWEEDIAGVTNIGRWAVSTKNIADGDTGITPDSTTAYLATVSSSVASPSANPTFGSTAGQGNMHIDTATGDIWMYV